MGKLIALKDHLLRHARNLLGHRYEQLTFEGQTLTLDTKWKHEFDYYSYIKTSKINGPIGMDVWAFSHFVKPGDVVLDAGANLGFTAILAKRAKASEIHCFEPDPRFSEKLQKHCQGECFHIYPVALGEEPGSLQLRLSTQHNQGSTLNDRHLKIFPTAYKDSERVAVKIETIDNLYKDKHLNFLKIDVEGAESAVLRGASSKLESDAPETIYIELYDEYFEEMHELLKAYYSYAYRMICNQNGDCQLVSLQTDLSSFDSKSIHTMPPSYIYSNQEQTELVETWTPPATHI